MTIHSTSLELGSCRLQCMKCSYLHVLISHFLLFHVGNMNNDSDMALTK